MYKVLFAMVGLALLAINAQAENPLSQGDWLVRAGVSNVDPDSDGLNVDGLGNVNAEDATAITFNGSYMLTDIFSIELLAATPFEHDIELDGTRVGTTKQLPPTLSFNWHIPFGDIVPYVGAGVNYTVFFDEDTRGPLSDATLNLDSSVGLAGQLGLDWFVDDSWLVNFNVRYIDIETRAEVDGSTLGDVDIDPWIYGLHVGYKF